MVEMTRRLVGSERKDIEMVDDEISSYVSLQSPI